MQNPKKWTFYFADFSDLNYKFASFSPDNNSLIEKNGHIMNLMLLMCDVGFVDSLSNKVFLFEKYALIKLEMQSYVGNCDIGNNQTLLRIHY